MATNNALNNSSAPFTVTAGDLTVTAGNILLANTTTTIGQIKFGGDRYIHNFGNTNCFFMGKTAGNTTNTSNSSIGIGSSALVSLSSGNSNIGIGTSALATCANGAANVGVGVSSLTSITSGSQNTAFGANAGNAYTGAETNNLCLGYNVTGTLGESNVIRIGNSSNTTCFIAGINGVTVANPSIVTLNTSTGQLGNQSYVGTTSWTPVLNFGGATTGITYAVQIGWYARVGQIITIWCDIQLSSKGSAVGSATITGVPVSSSINVPGSVRLNVISFSGMVTPRVAGTTINLEQTSDAGTLSALADTNFANNSVLQLCFTYVVV